MLDDKLAMVQPEQVRRVLLCSGKVYYDLLAEREARLGTAASEVALIRVEEIYPWPEERVAELVRRYSGAERVYWVQEEPANMGAWTFVRERIQDALLPSQKLAYAGRPPSASPAVGSMRLDRLEQARFLEIAFDDLG